MKSFGKIVLWGGFFALFVAGAVYAVWPQPVSVETATVSLGPMQVTIDEDGVTRVKDRYRVSSPVAGQLLRIELHSGDQITAGETLLATIRPSDPAMLDARQVAETEARASAAQSTIDRSEARRSQAKVARDLAESQFGRMKELLDAKSVPREEYEAAEAAFRSRQEELRVATFEQEIARFELEQAQAALGMLQPNGGDNLKHFEIRSPIDGVVLRVFQESSTVVTPGSALLEVGNHADLEIVVDVLSSDAVKIKKGDEMRLEHWGGDKPLTAKVRTVEPAAFTKISALGVEEQRVNVIGDFRDPSEAVAKLGDGYRVEARIVIWESDSVLRVPASALFRDGQSWAVFKVVDDHVEQQTIKIGKRNELFAEVIEGLDANSQVVVYPNDQVRDGVKIVARALDQD